jgi:hypothetical protein
MTLIVGPYLWVQENSHRSNQPMLPVVRDDDCDAIYLLLVTFYESSMIFKGRRVSPLLCRQSKVPGCKRQPTGGQWQRPAPIDCAYDSTIILKLLLSAPSAIAMLLVATILASCTSSRFGTTVGDNPVSTGGSPSDANTR